jgi:proline iminopeptidase
MSGTSRSVRVDGDRIYTRTFSPRGNARGTVLCVHGGPGATHDYLLPIADLCKIGYRVVFYDALGCGRSELPIGKSKFTIAHDLKVLEGVREGLNLGPLHLLGSSYGGLLVLRYATLRPRDLLSVVSTGGLSDVPYTVREMHRMIRTLPTAVQKTLRKYERARDFQHPEYLAAVQVFYDRFLCRLKPWPREVAYSLSHISQPVYLTMNGPNEFTIIGNIGEVNFTPELARIDVPTLLIHGRYDEVSPNMGRRMAKRIRGSKLVIMPRSSHVAFWEQRKDYLQLVGRFLDGVSAPTR